MVLNLFILLATFFFTVSIAWFAHKYVMHRLCFHQDYHQHEPSFFEKNDVFFLIFAIPSGLFTMFGMMGGNDWKLFVDLDIALYGLCYFLVHDVFIHRRFDLFKRTDNVYFGAIRKAYKVQHKHLNKEERECFVMLVVPLKSLREAIDPNPLNH